MKKRELVNRWKDRPFLEDSVSLIWILNEDGQDILNQDLRGITLGVKSKCELHYINLSERIIDSSDFSYGDYDRPFIESEITGCLFEHCHFDDNANFRGAKISDTSFHKSKFKAITFSKSKIDNCNLSQTKFISRCLGTDCSFVLAQVLNCDFSNSSLNDVLLRAATFKNCNFDNVVFTGCDIRGTKFLGSIPSDDQFIDCIRS